ncbi:hypothetical protein [uncultured Sphingomonas sp.]|uniref:hypothetical protein n=1 Tax=uncultured Sphingomonas sp. TaxID=158754 RepID=UPI0025DF85FF|nr:hypothetical protein [uncultured Sphingomonas sp.]
MTDATKPLRQLIEAVYLKTVSQELNWSFNPADDSCTAQLGPGAVEIVQETDEDGDYYSYAQIRNSQNEVVDTIYGGSLGRGSKPFNTGHKDYWELLRDLRSQAYRSAMGTDKIVSGMLAELNAVSLPLDEDDVPF